jgi:hypothetical protein
VNSKCPSLAVSSTPALSSAWTVWKSGLYHTVCSGQTMVTVSSRTAWVLQCAQGQPRLPVNEERPGPRDIFKDGLLKHRVSVPSGLHSYSKAWLSYNRDSVSRMPSTSNLLPSLQPKNQINLFLKYSLLLSVPCHRFGPIWCLVSGREI